MRNDSTIKEIMQEIIKEKEIEEIAKEYGYEEVARKATVSNVMRYHMSGAIEKCRSYRELETYGEKHTEVKQNFSLKRIFGSTLNAVYTQVIMNFIVYIVLFTVFSSRPNYGKIAKISFVGFIRKIRCDAFSFSLFHPFLNCL